MISAERNVGRVRVWTAQLFVRLRVLLTGTGQLSIRRFETWIGRQTRFLGDEAIVIYSGPVFKVCMWELRNNTLGARWHSGLLSATQSHKVSFYIPDFTSNVFRTLLAQHISPPKLSPTSKTPEYMCPLEDLLFQKQKSWEGGGGGAGW